MKLSKIYKVAISVILSFAIVASLIILPGVSAETTQTDYNLVTNGSFESDLTSGWNATTFADFSSVTAADEGITAVDGSKVLKIDTKKTWDWRQQDIAVETNTNYVLSFWVYRKTSSSTSVYKFGTPSNDQAIKTQVYLNNEAVGQWVNKKVNFNSGDYETVRLVFCAHTGVSYIDNVSIKKVVSITATADEGGIVSGAPTDSVLAGESVTLTATANSGYEFAGWYNGETKVSENAQYSFNASNDANFVAKFRAIDYNLITNGSFESDLTSGWNATTFADFSSVTAADEGITAVDGSKVLKIDTKKTWNFRRQDIAVETNTNYVLSFWVYRKTSSSTSVYKFGTPSNDQAIKTQVYLNNEAVGQWVNKKVNFNSGDYETVRLVFCAHTGVSYIDNVSIKKVVNVTATAQAGGTVTGLPDKVLQGDVLTLTATANSGYQFAGWYNGNSKVSDEAEYKFIAASDVSLTAKFENSNNLIANGGFENSTLAGWKNDYNRFSLSKDVYYEGAQSLYIAAQSGWGFGYYTLNVKENTDYCINMMVKVPTGANIPMIKVLNAPNSSTNLLDQSSNNNVWLNARNGNIKAGCNWEKAYFTFNSGSNTTVYLVLTGDAKAAAYIDNVSVLEYVTITATATSGGSISGLPTGIITVDTPITLTATAQAGFAFEGWYNGNTLVSTDEVYEFNASVDIALTAKFTAMSNYIVDGEFEFESLYSGWNNSYGRLSLTKDEFYEGEQSLYIQAQSGYGFGVYNFNAVPNTDYGITMMVKLPSGADAPTIKLEAKNSSGAWVGILDQKDAYGNCSINDGGKIKSGDDWKSFTVTFNSGEYSGYRLVFTGNAKAAAYIDNLILAETYTATIVAGENGSVNKTSVKGVKGTKTELTATPDADYMVEGWYINGQKVSSEKKYSHLFTQDVTVEVKFTLSTLPVMTDFNTSKVYCDEEDNLISDSSFEGEGAIWDTSTFIKDGVLDIVDYEGEKVLYFNPDGAGRQTVYFPIALKGNTKYMFSANVKGMYYSDTNHFDMSFGIMSDDGEYLLLSEASSGSYYNESSNISTTKSMTPPSWDNQWHRRGMIFKTVADTVVWVAVSGNLSEAYLDDFMLCEVSDSYAEKTVETTASVTNYTPKLIGCADKDNLVENYNFNSDSKGWEDGYGWKGLFSGTYIGNSGNNNYSLFMRSTTGYADNHYYIQWIDVKPETDYTISLASAATSQNSNFGILVEGAKRYTKLISWSVEGDSCWVYNAASFNSGDSTRIGLYVMDGGRVTALDEIRLFETANATELTNKLSGEADLPEKLEEEPVANENSSDTDTDNDTVTDDTSNEEENKTTKKTKKIKVVKKVGNSGSQDYTLWWIIGGIAAAIVIAGITVFIIIIVKKKKKKEAEL